MIKFITNVVLLAATTASVVNAQEGDRSPCKICPGVTSIPNKLAVFGYAGTEAVSCGNMAKFAMNDGLTIEQCMYAQEHAVEACGCTPQSDEAASMIAAEATIDFDMPVFCNVCFDGTITTSTQALGGMQCAAWQALGTSMQLSLGQCLNVQTAAATALGDPCGCGGTFTLSPAFPATLSPAVSPTTLSPAIPPAVVPSIVPPGTVCADDQILIEFGFLISNPSNFGFGTGTPLDFLAFITFLNLEAAVCIDPGNAPLRRQLERANRDAQRHRSLLLEGAMCNPDDLRFALFLAFSNPSNVEIGLPPPFGPILSALTFAELSIEACITSGLGPGRRELEAEGVEDSIGGTTGDDELASIFSIGLKPDHDDDML
jgi:hypothetical protein